jgi:hypothetical protein
MTLERKESDPSDHSAKEAPKPKPISNDTTGLSKIQSIGIEKAPPETVYEIVQAARGFSGRKVMNLKDTAAILPWFLKCSFQVLEVRDWFWRYRNHVE